MDNIFRIKQDLNTSKKQRKEHSTGLQKIISEDKHYEMFKFLYDNLNIIDSKASTLLSFNALVLVGVSIWLSGVYVLTLFLLVNALPVVLLILSSLCCLHITYLHWSSTSDFNDMDAHIDELIKVRDKRSVYYRIAWLFSFLSLIILIVIIIIGLLFHFN